MTRLLESKLVQIATKHAGLQQPIMALLLFRVRISTTLRQLVKAAERLNQTLELLLLVPTAVFNEIQVEPWFPKSPVKKEENNMTLKQEIQAKLDAYKAEVAALEAHLAAGGTWLDQEVDSLEAWFKDVVAKVRSKL